MKKIEFEKVGTDKVLISIHDFEDLMDMLAYDDAVSRDEETFPSDVTRALIEGANPVRVFRKYRDMTQGDLAAAIGVTQTTIAEIETGRKNGSLETMKKLAAALRVDLDDLVS